MLPIKDSFVDLERHQPLLEDNTERLRQALQQWCLWEAEYEALKEEVDSGRHRHLARIRRDFDGQLVTNKEVVDIFGSTDIKPAEQITNQLSRRLDYVKRNIETLEKKVRQAEDKAAAASVISQPDVRDEGGLPITDIVEELDDDDNVLSYRLQVPSDAKPQVREALEKAGVNLPSGAQSKAQGQLPDADSARASGKDNEEIEKGEKGQAQEQQGFISATSISSSAPRVGINKKTVSFTDGTKPEAHGAGSTQGVTSQAQKRLERIMQTAQEQEAMASQPAVTPIDESPEDAALRREMLAYGMSEIGPVVAELQLEEGSSDDDDDDGYEDEGDEDYDHTDDEDEDEDETGRSKRSVLSDAYLRRMIELEKRLGVSSNLTGIGTPDDPHVGRIAVGPLAAGRDTAATATVPGAGTETQTETSTALGIGGKSMRKVKFAQALDVSDGPVPPLAKPGAVGKLPRPTVEPLGDVIERNGPSSSVSPLPKPEWPGQAPTRFLDRERAVAPSGPDAQTLAGSVVERPPTMVTREPSEFDAALLHQEAAVEYHRIRNRIIQKDGGYFKENTAAIVPLDEEEGGPKRVSRFKAARLSRQ